MPPDRPTITGGTPQSETSHDRVETDSKPTRVGFDGQPTHADCDETEYRIWYSRSHRLRQLYPPSTSLPSGHGKYLGMVISSTGTPRKSSITLKSPFLEWLAGRATQRVLVRTRRRRGSPSVHRSSASNPLRTALHSRSFSAIHSPPRRPGVRAQAVRLPLEDALDGDSNRGITVGVHCKQHAQSHRKGDHYRLITVNGRHEPSRQPKRQCLCWLRMKCTSASSLLQYPVAFPSGRGCPQL